MRDRPGPRRQFGCCAARFFSRRFLSFFSCLTNAPFGAFRSIPTALSKRSHSVLPDIGGGGGGFILTPSYKASAYTQHQKNRLSSVFFLNCHVSISNILFDSFTRSMQRPLSLIPIVASIVTLPIVFIAFMQDPKIAKLTVPASP